MKKYLPISLIILILALAGVFVYPVRNFISNGASKYYPVRTSSNGANKSYTTNKTNGTNETSQMLSYTHPDLNFSFEYPGNYKLANLQDEQGETILLQENGKGLQIYISSFSGKEFNASLVRQNLLNEKLENLKDIAMPGGFNAVSFSGKSSSLGEIWDVWFVAGGKLYQITSQAGHDALLKSLVESFKFNQ